MTTILNTPGCQTKFLGPTNSRSARVKATHLLTGRSVTRSWDHALGAHENHDLAATELLGTSRLICCATDGGGWVYLVK